jgi:hypothetical protein
MTSKEQALALEVLTRTKNALQDINISRATLAEAIGEALEALTPSPDTFTFTREELESYIEDPIIGGATQRAYGQNEGRNNTIYIKGEYYESMGIN